MQIPFLTLLVAASSFLSGCSASMLVASCDSPRVSNVSVPSSYVFVLPYKHRGEARGDYGSRKINDAVTIKVMQIAADMDGTHVTLLKPSALGKNCEIEDVYDLVDDDRSGLFWRRLFHSAIFFWGEVYDRNENMVVQSHVRVLWNGQKDRQLTTIARQPKSTQDFEFNGDFPQSTISFPPQIVSKTNQELLLTSAYEKLEAKARPDLTAPSIALPSKFHVTGWKRPWLEIRDRDNNPLWILVTGSVEFDLGLPELSFVRILAAYLNYQVSPTASSRRDVLEAIKTFKASYHDLDDPLLRDPIALIDVIDGIIRSKILGDTQTAVQPNQLRGIADQSATIAALDDAVARLPANSDVLNLSAIVRIPDCCDGANSATKIREIQERLETARALDSSNRKIAVNLLTWYKYLRTVPPSQLPFDDLEQRIQRDEQTLSANNDPLSGGPIIWR